MKGLTCVEVEQTYSTEDINQPIDLEYLFVINKNAAVTKMIVQLGDSKVIGIIKEKEEAKQQYEEGIKQCKTMAYCEEDLQYPEIKRIKLGQLAPQKQLTVTFEYIQPLEVCFNKFYKVEVSPLIDENYVNQKKEIQLFAYLKNYVFLHFYQYNFTQDFKVSINTGSKLEFIKSPTHLLKILNGKNEFQDQLSIELDNIPNNFQPNKSFTLLFSTEDINLPTAILSHINNDALQSQKFCATLTFVPKFNEIPIDDAYQQYLDNLSFGQNKKINRGNYLFLIDRSGSMSGNNIEKAKQSLMLFLKSLPEDSFFNIVSFGSRHSQLWNKSKEYNQLSLDEALKHVKGMDADMGGTEIFGTLQSVVYNQDNLNNQTLNVFLLTDGEDSPEPIIQLVKQNNRPQTRIYTIGIGQSCCQYLIKRIAEVGNGKFQFVSDTADMSEKVIDLLEDSLTSYLEQFHMQSNIQNISQIIPDPESIVSLKKNQLLTIQILFSGELTQDNLEFQIGCYDPQEQQQIKYQVKLNIKDSIGNEYYHKMAINKQITLFENAQKNGDKELKEIKINKIQIDDSDIINLSVEHQILCSKTAFVCEICDVEDQFKQQERQKITINQTIVYIPNKNFYNDNYDRIDPADKIQSSMAFDDAIQYCDCCEDALDSELCNEQFECQSPPLELMQMTEIEKQNASFLEELMEIEQKQIVQQCQKLTYEEILQFAQADGSFQFFGQFYIDQIENTLNLPLNVWSTIFALLFLEISSNQQKNIWYLVYQKGVQFLSKNGIAYKEMKNLYFEKYKAILEKEN